MRHQTRILVHVHPGDLPLSPASVATDSLTGLPRMNNNMEPLNPSDAMMMPAAMPSSERTLILAQVRRLSLRRSARLENLHSDQIWPIASGLLFFVGCPGRRGADLRKHHLARRCGERNPAPRRAPKSPDRLL